MDIPTMDTATATVPDTILSMDMADMPAGWVSGLSAVSAAGGITITITGAFITACITIFAIFIMGVADSVMAGFIRVPAGSIMPEGFMGFTVAVMVVMAAAMGSMEAATVVMAAIVDLNMLSAR